MTTMLASLSDRLDRRLARLNQQSDADQMQLATVVPWDRGIDTAVPPKRPEAGWFYGTAAWERLTANQRTRLLWTEIARDSSMFIWLEQTIPGLFIGYVNTAREPLPKGLTEYLLTFSKEEIVHTQMFRRFLELAGLPTFGPPAGLHALFVERLLGMAPLYGILATMLIEWVAECTAVHATDAAGVEPLTREMFRRHHREEVRHIAFGRWVTEELFRALPAEERGPVVQFTETLLDRDIRQTTINAEIDQHVPFDLGLADEAAVEAARCSPNNRRINAERFGRVLEWVLRIGLVRPEYRIACVGEVTQ